MADLPKEAVEAACPFCDYAGPSEILHDFKTCIVIEPIDPVAPGHVLVVPREHVSDFTRRPSLTADVAYCAAAYASFKEIGPDYNLITSKGPAATQTVPHLHFHLVPRSHDDGLALPWSTSAIRKQERERAERAIKGTWCDNENCPCCTERTVAIRDALEDSDA